MIGSRVLEMRWSYYVHARRHMKATELVSVKSPTHSTAQYLALLAGMPILSGRQNIVSNTSPREALKSNTTFYLPQIAQGLRIDCASLVQLRLILGGP